eukprot:COSAG02_NODE_56530_length_285_cov_0.790323_1_plen_42_part_01
MADTAAAAAAAISALRAENDAADAALLAWQALAPKEDTIEPT